MALLHLKEEDILALEIVDPIKEGESFRSKEGILNVKIHLNNHTKVNIEMEIRRSHSWGERSLFYLCRVFTEDLSSGEHYDLLEPCIHVGILDFNYLKSSGFHHRIQLMDARTSARQTHE